MSYMDGFVTPVRAENRDAYLVAAETAWPVFQEYGALSQVECWGDDVRDGEITDFRRAVQAEAGEVIVLSWIEWPSRAVRDAGMQAIMHDPRIKAMDMPFDMKRMIYGGFQRVFDARLGGRT